MNGENRIDGFEGRGERSGVREEILRDKWEK